jgi:malonyl CoA-acyl carrier protein transacylase
MAHTGFNAAIDTDLGALLRRFNDTAYAYAATLTVHQLFERQAARLPDKIAAVHQGQGITYAGLNRMANQLARRLRDSGVGPGTIVALMVDRSLAMFVGILGILKAGAAYLPIDPGFPQARVRYMLDDAGVTLMLTQHTLMQSVPFAGSVICLDDQGIYRGDGSDLDPLAGPRDLVYVIYTSGSTGQPKGVMIENLPVHNFIAGVTRQIDFAPDKTIVCLTTISFDIFVLESLLPLSQGLTVVIADPMRFAGDLAGQRIDMLQTTPSTMSLLLQDPACLPYLRSCSEIMLGGEPFPKSLLQKLRGQFSARLYNMYGPTETTVWSTIQEVTAAGQITIGRPIANTQIYIVDEQFQPLGPGAIGELCIAGDGVARGYLNRPDLTAARFIPNPFTTTDDRRPTTDNETDAGGGRWSVVGGRLYRTGDLASWQASGQIEFFGRRDSQVKIRGFRIELGEIEDRLSAHLHVRESAVAAKLNEREEPYLVAYYTADKELTASELIAFLARHLPDYMIPGVYLRLERLPRTPNAKLDRQALPMPDTRRPYLDSPYIAPETELEHQLAGIWRMVLHRDEIGIHDNFFELGGNSVLLAQMVVEVEKLWPKRISVVDVFAYPTVARLKPLLQSSTGAAPEPPIPGRLSPANGQRRPVLRSGAPATVQPEGAGQSQRPQAPASASEQIALVFPGQGAQHVGMGQKLYNEHIIARQTFEEASDALGCDLRRLCFEGSAQELARTENTQPAILTVSIAASRVLLAESRVTPACVAGHSLGEIAALVCAEAIRFDDAVRLVRARGTAIQAAAAEGSGAMLAISGIGSELVEAECASYARDDAVVSISNYNAPDQVVISGQRHAVVSVGRALKDQGAAVIELNVSAPFHCALIQPAAEQFHARLSRVAFGPIKYPVIANATAAPYVSHHSIVDLLSIQLVKPVQWQASMRCLLQMGVKTIIDVGPGDVLRNLVKRTYPYLDVYAFDKDVDLLDRLGRGAPRAAFPDQRAARSALIERCLAIALCTPNHGAGDDHSTREALGLYRQVQTCLSRLRQDQQSPDLDHLHQALYMLTAIFSSRQTPPDEQFDRLNTLLRESGLPEVVGQYLTPTG